MAAADQYINPEAVVLTKKPSGKVPTNIPLNADANMERIILPKALFMEKPEFFYMREEAFIKECLQAAFSESSEGYM